jgi:hypothetical protein
VEWRKETKGGARGHRRLSLLGRRIIPWREGACLQREDAVGPLTLGTNTPNDLDVLVHEQELSRFTDVFFRGRELRGQAREAERVRLGAD